MMNRNLEEVDILFPDIVKPLLLWRKVLHIHNQSAERRDMVVREGDGIFWYAGELYHSRTGKSKRSIHPDDLEDFRRGFQERVAGKNMDEPWEYRVRDGSTYNPDQCQGENAE